MTLPACLEIKDPPIQTTAESRETIERHVGELDLDVIRLRLMESTQIRTLDDEEADQIIRRYRNFLVMKVISGTAIVPTNQIDITWQLHILDTQKYADDCEQCFGFFLHRFPYYGMRGEADRLRFSQLLEESSKLYQILFNEEYYLKRKGNPWVD